MRHPNVYGPCGPADPGAGMDDRDGVGTGVRMVLAATISAVVVAAVVIAVGGSIIDRADVTPSSGRQPLLMTAG